MTNAPLLRWQQLRRAAYRRLPLFLSDYIDGGAGDELALQRNRLDLDAIKLRPRVLRQMTDVSSTTEILGCECSMPVVVAPTGLNTLIARNGDVTLAQAANRAGIPFILSTASFTPIRELRAHVDLPPWFQLYAQNPALTEHLVRQAFLADCPVLVLTVDTPTGGIRWRDGRNNFGVRPSRQMMAQTLFRPRWLSQYLIGELSERLRPKRQQLSDDLLERKLDRSFDWDDCARLRDKWPRRLVLKGILSAEDAARAATMGVDGVVVSNHGGRQFDAAPSSWRVFSEIKQAVPAGMTLLVDGGIRTGDDVVRALALGAKGVLIGRLPLWALAAGGSKTLDAMFLSLAKQIIITMTLLGCRSPREVDSSCILEDWPG